MKPRNTNSSTTGAANTMTTNPSSSATHEPCDASTLVDGSRAGWPVISRRPATSSTAATPPTTNPSAAPTAACSKPSDGRILSDAERPRIHKAVRA